jgi:signal transduction histidine kinase
MDSGESLNSSIEHEDSSGGGDPLAILADELCKPIRAIRNAVTILESAGMLPGAMDRAHRVIIREIGQLSVLVGHLGDVAALAQGALRIRQEWIDVVPEVLEAVQSSAELLTDNGHSLSVGVPERPVYAYIDGPRLRQVITNLLHDACRHAAPFARIDLSFEADDCGLEVQVAGRPVAGGRLPQAPDVFTCPHTSFHVAARSIGLGLSLVREIVALHGGVVGLQRDNLGARWTFIVRLPICTRSALPAVQGRLSTDNHAHHPVGVESRHQRFVPVRSADSGA